MVRKLKYHEQKLLKKVDFITWKKDDTQRENRILRKYHIQKREDYTKYNKLCGKIHSLATKIKELDAKDPFKGEATKKLLDKFDFRWFPGFLRGWGGSPRPGTHRELFGACKSSALGLAWWPSYDLFFDPTFELCDFWDFRVWARKRPLRDGPSKDP